MTTQNTHATTGKRDKKKPPIIKSNPQIRNILEFANKKKAQASKSKLKQATPSKANTSPQKQAKTNLFLVRYSLCEVTTVAVGQKQKRKRPL